LLYTDLDKIIHKNRY